MNDNSENSQNAATEGMREDGSAKARLMEAATKLFAEHGLEGTSTRDIAKAADLNISLISYYFGGKEGLYKAVIFEFANRAQVSSDKILANLDLKNLDLEAFRKTMRSIVTEMVPMKYSNREIHVVLQREMMSGLPYAKDIYENVFSKILETVVGLIAAGQKKGFVRAEINPYVLFFSMAHSIDMYLHLERCPSKALEKIPKLPEELNQYIEQIYLIYIEGALK